MVKFNEEKCIGCGLCSQECPFGIISIRNGKANNHNIQCMQCGHCIAVCPADAVEIDNYDKEGIVECDKNISLTAEDYLYMIKSRRSIRKYKNIQVEKEKLENIIEAGRYTATAKNTQSNQFIVIQNDIEELKNVFWKGLEKLLQDEEKGKLVPKEIHMFLKNKLKNPENDFIFRNAPVVIFVANDKVVDGGLAAQNMENMAVVQNLGVLYNGYLSALTEAMPEVKEYIGVKKGKNIVMAMLVGYPDVNFKRTVPRRNADVSWR